MWVINVLSCTACAMSYDVARLCVCAMWWLRVVFWVYLVDFYSKCFCFVEYVDFIVV